MDACNACLWRLFLFYGGGSVAAYDGIIRIITGIDTKGLRQGESDIRGAVGRISDMAPFSFLWRWERGSV